MSNQKLSELQASHAEALQAADIATAKLNAKLLEHEQFR